MSRLLVGNARLRIHERTLERVGVPVDLDCAAVVHGAVRPGTRDAPCRRPLYRGIAAVGTRALRVRVLLQARMECDFAADLVDVVCRAAQPKAPPVTVGVHLDLDTLALI